MNADQIATFQMGTHPLLTASPIAHQVVNAAEIALGWMPRFCTEEEMELDETIRQRLITFQRTELTEHHIYKRLAKVIHPAENQHILEQIAKDELRHHHDWKRYTGQEVEPDQLKIWFYYWVSRIFGFTFGVKLMERSEEAAQKNYGQITAVIPEAAAFLHE
jgi:demethoxyubiquinone hydroxylase (CLK1/Coq7/Cat5 family)